MRRANSSVPVLQQTYLQLHGYVNVVGTFFALQITAKQNDSFNRTQKIIAGVYFLRACKSPLSALSPVARIMAFAALPRPKLGPLSVRWYASLSTSCVDCAVRTSACRSWIKCLALLLW